MTVTATPRPRRRARGIVLLAALVLLGAGVAAAVLLTRGSATASDSRTVWQRITAGIADGAVPKQTALEAFAYLYRTSIPGVDVPAGRDGADAPTSGTGVMRWVQGSWDQLTPDQQAVINRYSVPGPKDVVEQFDATAGTGPVLLARASTAVPRARLASDNPLFDAMQAEMLTDIRHLGPKLGIPLISADGVSVWANVTLTLSDQDGGNVLFETASYSSVLGGYTPCAITAYRNAWSHLPLVDGKVSETLHVLMTHEVVHCYQNVIWGGTATRAAIPPWIVEGSAIWLAADDTHAVEPWLPFAWRDYFDAETALTNRDYDAYGYFSLLDHEGRNMWGLMASAWKAAAASTTNRSDPFIAVLDGDASDVRDAWATGYLRRADWQDPWITYGFGLPDAVQVTPKPIEAISGGWPGTLLSRSNSVTRVASAAGEVVTVETTGLLGAHDEGTDMVVDATSDRFCTVDSCVCKPGTLHAGEDMAPQQMRLPFTLAFNAPEGGSTYVVTGHSLDELCGETSKPGPGTQPGGLAGPCPPQACAGDNGDPHMLTVDGHRYDFQAAGEFTLLRSADGAFEVQGRQEPWPDSNHVSVNTAVAALVAGHHVGVYVEDGQLVARVDGTAADATSPVDLGGGARLLRMSNGFEIDFPDGSVAWALSVGGWGINLQVRPSDAVRKGGSGILGPVLPGGLGVPSLPNGDRLPRATDRHGAYVELYGTLADAWRVTDATSLFDDVAAHPTASFAKPGFPIETATLTLVGVPPDEQVAAQGQCAPITDPDLRMQCVFDVAVTGEAGFVDQYQATQAFLAPDVAAVPAPTPEAPDASAVPAASETSGGPTPPAGITQLLPGIRALSGAALSSDGKLYLSVALPDDTFRVLVADPATGTVERQVDMPAAGLVALASGSVWLGQTTDAGGCAILRLDAATLATQATMTVPCDIDRPVFEPLGEDIWVLDQSAVDDNGNGVVLRRIDPSANTLSSTTVALPYTNGYIGGSPGSESIVYGDVGKDVVQLTPGAATVRSLGTLPILVYAVASGAWSEPGLFTDPAAGQNAILTGPAGVIASVPIDGPLVGADDRAAYVSGEPASDGSDTLWRYPQDGSAPAQVAQGAIFGPADAHVDLGYNDDGPLLITSDAAVRIWVPGSADPLSSPLDLQWIRLP